MKMKRIISAVLVFAFLLPCMLASAKTGEEHEADLEKALLGQTINTDIKSRPADNTNMNILFGYLEDAIYLCIDQAGSDGQKWLNELRDDFGLKDLPASVSEFSVPKSDAHQAYTHMGWDFKKYNEKSHWGVRQNILLATVSKVFSFPVSANVEGNDKYSAKCISMAKLIYYIHILGDHIADSYDNRLNVIQLAKLSRDEAGHLQELRKCLGVLLFDQRTSWKYCRLIVSLDAIRVKAHLLGEDDSEDKQKKVQQYAQEALDLLFNYLPALLKNEPYFNSVFHF